MVECSAFPALGCCGSSESKAQYLSEITIGIMKLTAVTEVITASETMYAISTFFIFLQIQCVVDNVTTIIKMLFSIAFIINLNIICLRRMVVGEPSGIVDAPPVLQIVDVRDYFPETMLFDIIDTE